MRILHVVTGFPRFRDDFIAPWLVELLRHLRSRGHEAEVFSPAYKGGGNRELDGIPIHRFRYFPAPWEDLTHDEAVVYRLKRSFRYRLAVPFYLAGGSLAMWKLCRRQRYDVVHVHWPMPHALFGWVGRAACGARVLTTFYGVELRWVKTKLPFLRGFLARAIRSSDRVTAISDYTAREVRELADVPVTVIPYTTALPGPTSPVRSSGTDSLTVLFVGTLVARKGVTILIEAVRLLRDVLPLNVVVVGDGPERPGLEREVARQGLSGLIEFTGRVPPDTLARAYSEASMFVLPAVVDARGDTEGLGVVLLEAMSYGVPVVASAAGGITDIVENEQTGLLVPPGNAQALAGAIRRLAEDARLRAQLGTAGQARFEAQFSWPAIVSRWDQVYRELADPPTPPARRSP
jgi:glycosyltransferase involved in cell wall biosynthesis